MGFNINTTDRLTARIAVNVIEVYKESDFGPKNSGVIVLQSGVTYILKDQVLTDAQFDISGIPTFVPAVIKAEQQSTNTLISIGTGGGSGGAFFITSDPSQSGALVLDTLTIALGGGDRPFANLETTAHFNAILNMKAVTVSGFADGTVFKNIGMTFGALTSWANSGRIDLVDMDILFDEGFVTNAVDSNDYIIQVKSDDQAVKSRLVINNSGLSSFPNESLFFIHSNLSPTSELLMTRLHVNFFSPGTGGHFGEDTGSVSTIASAGGGKIVVGAAGHTGENNDLITHTAFSDPNYNGDFIIENVTIGISYEITATFTATGTGTWTNTSLDQTDPRIKSQNNTLINLKDSMSLAETRTNAFITVSGAQNTFVPVETAVPASGDWIKDPATERFSINTATGLITYIGLVDTAIDLTYKIIATASPDQLVAFSIFINEIDQTKSTIVLDMASTDTQSYIGGLFAITNGDTIQLYRDNRTNGNDTDVDATILIFGL